MLHEWHWSSIDCHMNFWIISLLCSNVNVHVFLLFLFLFRVFDALHELPLAFVLNMIPSLETKDGVKIDNAEWHMEKKKSTKLVIISCFFCSIFFFVLLLMRQLIHSFRYVVRLEQKRQQQQQQNYEFQIWKCFISPFYCSLLDLLQHCPAQDKRNFTNKSNDSCSNNMAW